MAVHVRPGPNDIGDQNGDSRPIYGSGDGSDFANAFAGLDDPGIDWTAAGLELVVHGFHCRRGPQKWTGGDLIKPTGGTAKRHAIIRGDGHLFGGERGIIAGCINHDNEGTWVNHATYTNVWYVALASGSPHVPEQFLFERTGAGYGLADFSKLDLHPFVTDLDTTLSNLNSADGDFYWDSGTNTIYVNPLGNADPTDKLLHGVYGYWGGGNSAGNAPPPYVTFYRVHLFAWRQLAWKGDFKRRRYVECEISYSTSVFNQVLDATDGGGDMESVTIERCRFHHVAHGVYPQDVDDYGVTGLQIVDCRFEDIGPADFLDSGAGSIDSHAVGLQTGNGISIRRNIARRAGKAFSFWLSSNGEATAITFRNNFVDTPHNSAGRIDYIDGDGGQMVFSYGASPSGSLSVAVKDNFLRGPVNTGEHAQVARDKWPAGVQWVGNVIDGNHTTDAVIRVSDDAGGTVLYGRDNFILNPRPTSDDQYIEFANLPNCSVDLDRNVYSDGQYFYAGLDGGNENFAAFQARGSGFEPNGIDIG